MLQAGDNGIKFTVKDVKNPNTGRPTTLLPSVRSRWTASRSAKLNMVCRSKTQSHTACIPIASIFDLFLSRQKS